MSDLWRHSRLKLDNVKSVLNGNYLVHIAQCFLLRQMQWSFVHCEQGFFRNKEGQTCCLCTSRVAFRARNIFVFVHFARCFSVKQRFLLLFVYFTRFFQNEEYSCCLCTSRTDFRARNTLVVCALCVALSVVRGSSCLCTSRGG